MDKRLRAHLWYADMDQSWYNFDESAYFYVIVIEEYTLAYITKFI